jgi:hypothetical protein
METTTHYLDRMLDPLTDCFTPALARRLADLRADDQTRARLDELAAKANEGRLSSQEDAEYKAAIDTIDLLAILQAKARAFLRQHAAP